jgi:hypothetical protein
VLSFENGWYQILLQGKRAFIFGAYLLPLDFSISPYRVGTFDGVALLLKQFVYKGWYEILEPDGEKKYIHEKYVKFAV